MKRLSCVALATGFFALSAPADSSAQTSIFVGGGATFPVGSIASAGPFVGHNTGWQGTAGAQCALGESGFTLGPRLHYGSNKSETAGNKSNVYGGTALANYNFGEPDAVNPFLWAELGVMSIAFTSETVPASDNTSTAAALAGGVGVGFPLGGVNGFLAAGFNSDLGGDIDMTYFGLYAGLSFALSGG